MSEIIEYNVSTGHVETLARVPHEEAQREVEKLQDGSTDHVILIREEPQ